jgi:hypothetical protein
VGNASQYLQVFGNCCTCDVTLCLVPAVSKSYYSELKSQTLYFYTVIKDISASILSNNSAEAGRKLRPLS